MLNSATHTPLNMAKIVNNQGGVQKHPHYWWANAPCYMGEPCRRACWRLPVRLCAAYTIEGQRARSRQSENAAPGPAIEAAIKQFLNSCEATTLVEYGSVLAIRMREFCKDDASGSSKNKTITFETMLFELQTFELVQPRRIGFEMSPSQKQVAGWRSSRST